MSTINKKPFIKSVIESLSENDLSDLLGLLDETSNNYELKSFINPDDDYAITSDDKDIKKIILETSGKVYTGILVYNNTCCVLISYSKDTAQKLEILILNPSTKSFSIVEQPLSINELRRLVEIALINIEQSGDSSLYSKVFHFEENAVLSDEVLNSLKDGDVIIVYSNPYVIKKTDKTTHWEIYGTSLKMIVDANDKDNVYITELKWSTQGQKKLVIYAHQFVVPEPASAE